MTKQIILVFAICCFAVNLFAQQIKRAEYFIDGPDPGVGNATLVPGFTSSVNDTLSFNAVIPAINLSSQNLSSGFHTLVIRFQDNNNVWSMNEARPFYIVPPAAFALSTHFESSEYFIDGPDPGVGNAKAIPGFTNSSNDSVLFNTTIAALNLSLQTLSPGFHTLVTRFRDNNGIWTMNEARAFYIVATPSVTVASHLEAGEYFIDGPDPGNGNATAIPGFTITANDTVQFSTKIAALNLSLNELSTGFHTLVTRFRDNNNVWSQSEARPFYVNPPTSAPTAVRLVASEYFIDGPDPGVGNAQSLPGFTGANGDTVMFNGSVPALTLGGQPLGIGFHSLITRFRDNNGIWSMNQAQQFYIGPTPEVAAAKIVAAEYFFGVTDPGVGKATAVSGFTPQDSSNFSTLIKVPAFFLAGYSYPFTMRVKDSNGEWSLSESRNFHICDSVAEAGFKYTISGNTLAFTDTSIDAYGYLWNFGDDSTSTLKNPVHTYAYGGIFNITEIALSPCGNDTVVKQVNFTCTSPSSAYFTTSTTGLEVVTANYSTGATTYSWNFGDGTSSTAFAPTHTYNVNVTTNYKITLTASNGCGSVKYSYTVTVSCIPPVSLFSYFLTGQTASFTNQSSNAFSILWEFGDGAVSNLQNPSHTYSATGTYAATLVVTNACGIDSIQDSIYIICKKPVSAFIYNSNGLSAEFQNNSANGASYSWYFGDLTTGTLSNPTHIYKTTGTYEVCLVSKNACGRDSTCDSVSVCVPPTASFVSADSALTTTFTNESLNGQSYFWTFGNGQASNVINPVITYSSLGTYNVCLVVNNLCGTSSLCKKVSTSCTIFGAPSICMVTVDTLGKNNIIYWDKTPYAGGAVDSFTVYREVSTNVYMPLKTLAYGDTSLLVDTFRTKYSSLANGDPGITSYRYKLQFMDTCGGLSPLSPYHNTIHIENPSNGQFTWNLYEIEGNTTPVNNYALYRDSLSNFKWKLIGVSTGTQGNLEDVACFNNPTPYVKSRWEVRTEWGITCTPTARLMQSSSVNTSRSNIRNNLAISGIEDFDISGSVQIYPNPAKNNLTVEWQEIIAADQPQIAVVNCLGMELLHFTPEKNQLKTSLNISNLAAGLYFVEIRGNKYRSVKKVIVQ